MKAETKIISRLWTTDARGNHLPTTVNPPVYRGSTVLFDNFEDMVLAGRGQYAGPTYGTDRFPVQRCMEEAMRELEGGFITRIFPSGIAAIQNFFYAFSKSGDHILLVDNAYGPGVRFCKKVLAKFDIETTFVPPSVAEDIEKYIRPNTVLILLESPGSNTFEIQDIPAVVSIAKKHDIITALDNTWATPLYLKPFALGVDVSIQAVSKYISGYSDVLMGAVTVNERYGHTLDNFYSVTETYTPDSDCYLALRGMKTLPTRLRQHEQSALQVAAWLEKHKNVDTVIHPALPSHPEHHLWQRDFSGSSGLFAFILKKDYPMEELALFINKLNQFDLGYSWGGYKSLLTAAKQRRNNPSRFSGKTIIRLSIGLEGVEDLILDLEQGLAMLS